jgi:hypothetical protein
MATQEAKRCPLCGLRQSAAISDEARTRETGGDTWRLTAKGARILEEMRQREATSYRNYLQDNYPPELAC